MKQYDLANSKKDDYLPLSERPQIVAINKTEIIEPRKMDELLLRLSEKGIKPIEISAATGLNLDKLILEMGRWVFKNESPKKLAFWWFFNPIHQGHLNSMLTVADRMNLATIKVVPGKTSSIETPDRRTYARRKDFKW